MSKAILILDEMPEDCCQCPCFIEKVRFDGMKWHASCYKLKKEVGEYGRPSLCPLKPMPEELDATEIAMQCGMDEVDGKLVYQVEGYNRCIERILGE